MVIPNLQRDRMNSNDFGKKEMLSPKMPKYHVKGTVIGREPISVLVDPVPLSVRLSMQREKERGRKK